MKRPYEILKDIPENELRVLAQSGYCPPTVFRNLEVFYYVDALQKSGVKRNAAILDAEVNFKVCRRTVYNIVNSLK